ncbi:hypothetical protein HETIRDRAFT_419228 [Heterobasidion irregulare TC 32-1]|uniref:Uncharacterized protein n=1 Tax=Heterobasidion irregulare (strain TC 32-1) TaxID=747525 RepID=W4K374_HETIT|nr:uncharacterized protein HETIRDRAFT_419228 [Heterobasidion irregulare TC 32-1]ETW79526.1 hypothetical protein HETIRDRAFT_419228 [Heterobasidion irregulare TC 32-1]
MPQQYAEMCNVPYQELIGSGMYAAVAARPDICFAVSYLLQFMQNPERIEGFSDADHGGQEHRCSISGYIFLFDGGAVSWSSKKQTIVAQSSTKAEYIALAHAKKEVLWIRMLLSNLLSPLTVPTINLIELRYCPIEEMAADGFTKPLACQKVEKMAELIGLQEI